MIAFWFWAIFPFIRIWATVEVSLQVDNPRPQLGEQVEMQVSVNGNQQIQQVEIVGLENFTVENNGTSSQIRIINGDTQVQKIFSYLLFPKKTGSFALGPAKVVVEGEVYQSAVINFNVGAGAENNQENTNQARIPQNKYYFLEASVDQGKPYVGQQFVYTLKLYTRTRILEAGLEMPELNNFWKEQIGKEQSYQTQLQGEIWQVTEVKHLLMPLSAAKTGKVELPPAAIMATVMVPAQRQQRAATRGRGGLLEQIFDDEFFGGAFGQRQRVKISSNPVEVELRSLPAENRPAVANIFVGAVEISSQVDKTSLPRGDSLTFTLKLTGNSYLDGANFDHIDFANFRVYPDRPVPAQRQMQGESFIESKVLKWALVPQAEGTLTIPAISVASFNPTTGQYQTVQTNPITIQVTAARAGSENLHVVGASPQAAPTASPTQIKKIADDIMPIKYSLREFERFFFSSSLVKLCWMIIILIPVICFPLGIFLAKAQAKLLDPKHLRRQKAWRQFQKNLAREKAGAKFYSNVGVAFREYLGNRFNMDGIALTAIDVDRKLPAHLPVAQKEEIKSILNNLDQQLYSGNYSETQFQEQLIFQKKLLNLAKSLEKE